MQKSRNTYTVKSNFKALGLYNFRGGLGWAYKRGGAYIRGLISGIKKMFRNDEIKQYLRNELKQTYHYILSYIYNTFTVRHNKRKIYFTNTYKTDLCDCLKKNAKGTVDELVNGREGGGSYPGGLISEIIYSFANEWAYIRGGLKPGGALKWDFTVFTFNKIYLH